MNEQQLAAAQKSLAELYELEATYLQALQERNAFESFLFAQRERLGEEGEEGMYDAATTEDGPTAEQLLEEASEWLDDHGLTASSDVLRRKHDELRVKLSSSFPGLKVIPRPEGEDVYL